MSDYLISKNAYTLKNQCALKLSQGTTLIKPVTQIINFYIYWLQPKMPERFTFPNINQAMSLQSAESIQDIRISLRKWFNENSNLKLSENVAWSFKNLQSSIIYRRYIHCIFCQAKMIYVKEIKNNLNGRSGNQSDTFKLVKFNLHHNHKDIESVKQKGKRKTFPHKYPQFQVKQFSNQKQRKLRKQKMRKRRMQINKYKKLQLYYRLNLRVKQSDRKVINVKACAAKALKMDEDKFIAFLNSNTRGMIQFLAIKQLLKRSGFQKYNIQFDNTGKVKYNKSRVQDQPNQNEINSEDQDETTAPKSKQNTSSAMQEETLEFFKQLLVLVNYNESSKKLLQQSEGLINITHIPKAIMSKKMSDKIRWDVLVLYSHESNFIPNQLYAIIMIDSEQFNIRQIKKSFEITFKLLNPLKKFQIKCCIHQENIYIMGALDLIIEQMQVKRQENSGKQSKNADLSYFLSPELSTSIINKCQFIPKIFRGRLIDKIYQLDGKEIDSEFQKIIQELQKASKIKQFKSRTEQYIAQLKQFAQNSHKIFIGKLSNPSFVGLIFQGHQKRTAQSQNSMFQKLNYRLMSYPSGQKHFFQFLIMILEIFQLPGSSFIYNKFEGQTREPTKLEKQYSNYLISKEQKCIDQMKQYYNQNAQKRKYTKLKAIEDEQLADFFDQFCAILYQRVYQIKQIFMKLPSEAMKIFIRQIQKSFTLQIQTRTLDQIKKDGFIKAKQVNKPPYTVKILNPSRFQPCQKLKKSTIQMETETQVETYKSKKIIEVQKSPEIVDLETTESSKKQWIPEGLKEGQKNNKREELLGSKKKLWRCSCKFSMFTFLPCCHQIRCCLTFFTSIQDQISNFWLFDPMSLQNLQQNSDKSDNQSYQDKKFNQNQEKQGQYNSESD